MLKNKNCNIPSVGKGKSMVVAEIPKEEATARNVSGTLIS